MTDILVALYEKMASIKDPSDEYYVLLSRAVAEIDRLRKSNSDMGWRLNPDRSGGAFSDWETNRRGDEWS